MFNAVDGSLLLWRKCNSCRCRIQMKGVICSLHSTHPSMSLEQEYLARVAEIPPRKVEKKKKNV